MFCPECGSQNPDGSRFCSSCASQLPPMSAPEQPQQGAGPLGTKVMPPTASNQPPMQQPYASPPPMQQPPYAPPAPGMENYGAYPPQQGGYPGQQGGYPGMDMGYQQNQYQNPQPYPVPPGYPPPQMAVPGEKASGRAIAAGVLGITAIVPGLCLGIGLILGVIGAILGKMEMDQIKQGRAPRAGDILAKIGFFAGIAGAGLSFLIMAACMLANMGN